MADRIICATTHSLCGLKPSASELPPAISLVYFLYSFLLFPSGNLVHELTLIVLSQ